MSDSFHDGLVILSLAEDVAREEDNVQTAATRLHDQTIKTLEAVKYGQRLNRLGETQFGGPTLDAAVGRLEQAAASLQAALAYLKPPEPQQEPEGDIREDLIAVREQIRRVRERSPRVRAIVPWIKE